MPETELLGLANEDEVHIIRRRRMQRLVKLLLALGKQFSLEFRHPVEVILDRPLVATGDDDHLLNPSLGRLLHCILNQRLVDDRHHFLRHGLGGR